jgi:spore coat protein A
LYNAATVNGFQGDVLVVNGTPHPYLSVSRQKYRFRLLNAANARRIDVGLSTGTMYQIATDGGLLPSLQSPSRIALAPAERVDIVIDFAQYRIGDVVTLLNDDPFTPVLPEIIQFRVTSNATDTSALPTMLNTLYAPLPAATNTRTIVFARNAAGDWQMNSLSYDPASIAFPDVKLNTVETWVLQNIDPLIPHPFHQHLVQFQIVDVCQMAAMSCDACKTAATCGSMPPATQQGWKDTVLIPPQTQVRVKMKFYYTGTDTFNGGQYVFHCHNLEHEDHAMMLQQTVSP